MSNLTVIITAYNSSEYIKECIESIKDSNSNVEIIVGVDYCSATLKVANTISGIRLFSTVQNVGTYILRNSLAKKATNDNLLFFDSDDIMNKTMIEQIMRYEHYEQVRFKYKCMMRGVIHKESKAYGEGVFFIKKSVFFEMGGFYPGRCGWDTEFRKRCETKNVLTKYVNTPLFLYRQHNNSLSHNKNTNFKSIERAKAIKYICKKQFEIIPLTTCKIVKIC